MTRLQWNGMNDRFFEAGLDRGVLYTPEGLIVPWNGLVSVDETAAYELGSPVYLDGRAVYQSQNPGDFKGTLTAFTYPDEFAVLSGLEQVRDGLFLGNQLTHRFGLSWRTMVNNGTDPAAGYKIHILYNVLATPGAVGHKTLGADVDPLLFTWDLSTIPSEALGHRPTAHVVIDSRKIDKYRLESIERYLYGDDYREPTPLGTLADLIRYVDNDVLFSVVDNGDGTWTVEGPDDLIQKIGDNEWFVINGIDMVVLDPTTYSISTTEY